MLWLFYEMVKGMLRGLLRKPPLTAKNASETRLLGEAWFLMTNYFCYSGTRVNGELAAGRGHCRPLAPRALGLV